MVVRSSSRSVACRAGCWGGQPIRRSSSHTPGTVQLTPDSFPDQRAHPHPRPPLIGVPVRGRAAPQLRFHPGDIFRAQPGQ